MPIINDHHVLSDAPDEPRQSPGNYSGITVLVCALLAILLFAGNLRF